MLVNQILNILEDTKVRLVLLGVFLLFLMFIIDVTTETIRKMSRAKKIIKTRIPKLLALKKNYDTISSQASCYVNTLGGEGANFIAEVRTILEDNIRLINSLEESTSNLDISEISIIFEENILSKNEEFNNSMKRANQIIDHLSQKIISASITSTKLGIPKIRKHNSTSDSLSRIEREV